MILNEMDSAERLFKRLIKPDLEEMMVIMRKFHWSPEYLNSNDKVEKSTKKLEEYGWGFNEFCRAIGSID